MTVLNANEIKRKILVLHEADDTLPDSHVHTKLETILNHYGYYTEHLEINKIDLNKKTDEYAGLILWNYSTQTDDPIELINYIQKFKNKKNIIIGTIPYEDKNNKSHFNEINKILKSDFKFSLGEVWTKNTSLVKQNYNKQYFNYTNIPCKTR